MDDWRLWALCSLEEKPVSFFYPNTAAEAEKAKAYCQECVVKEDCLNTGIKQREQGIWGGTLEHERVKISGDRYLQAMRQAELQRSIQRDKERPASVFHVHFSGISFLQTHNQQALSKAPVSPPVYVSEKIKQLLHQLREEQSYRSNQKPRAGLSEDVLRNFLQQLRQTLQSNPQNPKLSRPETLSHLPERFFSLPPESEQAL